MTILNTNERNDMEDSDMDLRNERYVRERVQWENEGLYPGEVAALLRLVQRAKAELRDAHNEGDAKLMLDRLEVKLTHLSSMFTGNKSLEG
jgi:hypothetical protein